MPPRSMNRFPKAADYFKRARDLEAGAAAPDQRDVTSVAVLSSFTADFLRPYLIVEAAELGLSVRPWFGPFGAFEQQVLDDRAPLWAQLPEVVWIAMRIEDVDPQLVHDLPEIGPERAAERLGHLRQRVVQLAEAIRARSTANILVSNFACPRPLDLFDASDPDGLSHLCAAENRELARALTRITGAHVFDWNGVIGGWGTARATDAKLWYLARTPIAADLQPVVARNLARCLRALLHPAAKCIVVDLDNTLWGGVLGDDGAEGLQLGDLHPGRAFRDLQYALRELRRRGFLLAIASKNDAALVGDTLASHPEMVLRPGDFAAIVANWEPKPTNLRQIAATLNIGLDALVFIDDNPVERAHVRAELPMVHVVEWPTDPLKFASALADVAVLDRPRLLADDRARAARVAHDQKRLALEHGAASVDEFLSGLQMVATIGAGDEIELPRIHQLIHKTNQFNLTTRRHPIEEIAQLSRSPAAAVRWLRLRDRFGDLGLVCVGIVRPSDDGTWEIDTFLMSCRVMGRGVEQAFLHDLVRAAIEAGARRIRGVYRPTPKNHIVADFYRQYGFAEIGRTGEAVEYEISEAALPSWPPFIEREASST